MIDQPTTDDNSKAKDDDSPTRLGDEVQTKHTSENQEHPTQKASPLKDGPKWTDKAIVFLTFGIVLLAFMQWREMADAGKQTDRIICADERLAAAMESSARNAEKSLNATIAQNQLDQRAWVTTTGVQGNPEVGKPWKIVLLISNTGKTIARNLLTTQVISQLPKSKEPAFKLGPLTRQGVLSPGATGINTNYFSNGMPLPKLAFDQIVGGDIASYIYGRIEYDDIFGKHHATEYCYAFSLAAEGWKNCSSHNMAD